MRFPTALPLLVLLPAPALRAHVGTDPHAIAPRSRHRYNDAGEYYSYGMQTVSSKPSASVRAFYWAMLINPASADAIYAYRTATLLAMTKSELRLWR